MALLAGYCGWPAPAAIILCGLYYSKRYSGVSRTFSVDKIFSWRSALLCVASAFRALKTCELLTWRCIIMFEIGVVGSAFSTNMHSELPWESFAS